MRAREAALLQFLDGGVRVESECPHTLVSMVTVFLIFGCGEGGAGALGDIAGEATLLQVFDESIKIDVDDHV